MTDPVLSDKGEGRGPWEVDSIEIYVSENNQKGTTYEAGDYQYRINYKGQLTAMNEEWLEGMRAHVTLTDNGYIVQAKIPFKTIKPTEGMKIGFDIQVSDDPGSGIREFVSSWNSTDEGQSHSLFTIGDILLGPSVTENPEEPVEDTEGPIWSKESILNGKKAGKRDLELVLG